MANSTPADYLNWLKTKKPRFRPKAFGGKEAASSTQPVASSSKTPSKQKALVLDGKYGQFVVNTVDVSKPGPGEILVKIQSASLNALDWKIQKHGIFVDHYPVVIGRDIAGDVAEVGFGVTEVAVGERVFLQGDSEGDNGAFQQYAVVESHLLAKIPPNLSYDQASTLPVTLTTAYLALFNKRPHGLALPNPLTDGPNQCAKQTLVILGGPGSVAQFALQLAKLSGFSNIISVASLKHTNLLTSLGATHVLDRYTPPSTLPAEISKITGEDKGVMYVLDAVSSVETQQIGYDLLTSGGRMAIILADAVEKKVEGKKVVRVNGNANATENYDAVMIFFQGITPLLERGVIKPVSVQVIPKGLAGVADGLQLLEDNQASGLKLVARPQETA
jgi:NADPH:quinone reductase-like Zn-dependent oxidoreductase